MTLTKHPALASEIQQKEVARLRFLVEFAKGQHDSRELFLFSTAMLGGRGGARKMTDSEMSDLRRWLMKGFETMANGGKWEIKSEELAPYSVILSTDGASYYYSTNGKAFPQQALLRAIRAEEWRIARCAWPECGKLFVRKKRGAYCSPKCSQRMRTKRHRDPRFRKAEARSRRESGTSFTTQISSPAKSSVKRSTTSKKDRDQGVSANGE